MQVTEERNRKIEIFEYLLDECIEKAKYYCGSIAYNGKVLVRSEKRDSRINLQYLTSLGTYLFNDLGNGLKDHPLDLLISEELRKVYLRKFWIEPNSPDYLLVIALPPNTLYFRRPINTLVKRICDFLP